MRDIQDIIVISHFLTSVPVVDLEDYLLAHKARNCLFIRHPLNLSLKKEIYSTYRHYQGGILVKEFKLRRYPFPLVLQYILDMVLNILWILGTHRKWGLAITIDNLNSISVFPLKLLRLVEKNIFYTIDYVPNRFDSKIMNEVYHYVDYLAVKYSNRVWNLTTRVTEARESLRNIKYQEHSHQMVVPVGVWTDRIEEIPYERIEKHKIIYAGGLSKHQGIEQVISAMPAIIREISDATFDIIGLGSLKEEIEIQIKQLKLEEKVHLVGYFEKHEDVEKYLCKCGLAVAMYDREFARWSYYADPSKIKTYLVSSLPIVTSDLTSISTLLVDKGCGVIAQCDPDDISQKIISILKNENVHAQMRKQARQLAEEYNWTDVFGKGLDFDA